MTYVSLYRQYRPQTFADVVGQEHVTTTLQNAIRTGRMASGYLFTGTRGTAKTTCARILAKALNCIGPDGTRTSPSPDPCGVCGPCRAIAASSFVDVVEMDAASHGKVDDVRDLVASIKFPPMEGRYKVYIIDEAHQLSRDAMDAFLKTLEEPPDRVIFVLATTELDKLPITIASRCQVFEFRRGSVGQIASRLSQVLSSEGVQAEPGAVTLIARAAEGSYRDSLSLLEQVLAYQRERVTAHDVTQVLGIVDSDLLNTVVETLASSDAAGTFALTSQILGEGRDVRQFLKSLSGRFRDMLFVSVGATATDAAEIDDTDLLRAQASRFSPAALLQALETLTEAERETRQNQQQRLLLEMTLLRLVRLPQVPTAAAPLVQASTHPVTPTASAKPITATQVPPVIEPKPSVPVKEVIKELEPLLAVSSPIAPPISSAEVDRLAGADSDDESDLDESDLADDPLDDMEMPLPGDDDLDILLDEGETPFVPSMMVTSSDEADDSRDLLQVQQVAVSETPLPTPPVPIVHSESEPPELARLRKSWQEALNRMSNLPATVAMIRKAEPVSLVGSTITLQFDNPVSVDKINTNERGRQVVEDAINKTLGVEPKTFKIKAIMQGATPAKVALSTAPRPRDVYSAPIKENVSSPEPHSALLEEVIAVFGGRLVDDERTN